jgi:hypothetical protein
MTGAARGADPKVMAADKVLFPLRYLTCDID